MQKVFSDIFPKLKFRYSWKLLELITIFAMARLIMPRDLGIGFLSIVFSSLLLHLFRIRYDGKETQKIKRFYNTLSVAVPLASAAAVGVIFIFSYAFPQGILSEALRYSSILLMIGSFSVVPEAYFFSRGSHEKVYKAYFISQTFSSVLMISLAVYGAGSHAVVYGYILFHLANSVQLWKKFPFRLDPKIHDSSLEEIISLKKTNLKHYLLFPFAEYFLLIFSAFAFGIVSFAYFYFAYLLGSFLYKNITLFITDSLLPYFNSIKEKEDLFRINLERISEYCAFVVVPFSVLFFFLSYETLFYLLGQPWASSVGIFSFFVLWGMLKAVSEMNRLVCLTKEKEIVIERIRIMELLVLALLLPLAYLFGIWGLIAAILVSAIFSSLMYFAAASRISRFRLGNTREYFYVFFAGTLAGLFIGVIKEFIELKGLFSLFLFYAFGKIVYLSLTFLFNKDLYKRFIRLVFKEE